MRLANWQAGWLVTRADDFPPLHIVRVDPSVDPDDDGELSIMLTVVLEDPTDPDEGWSVDAVFRLYRAVREETLHARHVQAHVHLQAESDEAA